MNNQEVITQARAAADFVVRSRAEDDDRISLAYQRSLSRLPSQEERKLTVDYLHRSASGNDSEAEIRDTWARLIQTLWATPEFRLVK